MNHTDPTYLRTIHDGLLLGTIHKDNASNLPIGLIGIYEEALHPASNVNERKKFLEFFAVWALLKKEVSAVFVLPLLEGWTEEQVIDYIALYSKWFNSPVSGKYALYHERLRTFILQKVSHQHFEMCNESIIAQSQKALQNKVGDEWERYSLEYLSKHLLTKAIESKDEEALKTLSYNTTHWNRQVEISKGFEWSKRMLNDMMLWASKYGEDEVIECALNRMDLHHLEQNDAPRVMELVSQNDIETALLRIESFGENDKEGLQRKFILYMLCLMELTVLDTKHRPFGKGAIEKLLKHLDDNLPVDHSVLNWNDFFSSYLMFQMACEWEIVGVDYLILYKWTEDWDINWLNEKGPYSDLQFQVLQKCAQKIGSDFSKSSALKELSIQMAIQGKIKHALKCANAIIYKKDKYLVIKKISVELVKRGKIVKALKYIEGVGGLYNQDWRSITLAAVSGELFINGMIDQARSIMQEALQCARGIIDEYAYEKSKAMIEIVIELNRQGMVEESEKVVEDILKCIPKLSNYFYKDEILKNISLELVKQGKLTDALERVREMPSDGTKRVALIEIIKELVKRGNIEKAQELTRSAHDENHKSEAYQSISFELVIQGNIKEALESTISISDEIYKNRALHLISVELVKQGDLEEALQVASKISSERASNSRVLNEISAELRKQGEYTKAIDVLRKSLHCAHGIDDYLSRSSIFKDISVELIKQNLIEEALDCVLYIPDESYKRNALWYIASELAKQGKIKHVYNSVIPEILKYSHGLTDEYLKYSSLVLVSTELAKRGMMQEAQKIARSFGAEWMISNALKVISIELLKLGKTEEAIECTIDISDQSVKCSALIDISAELARQGKKEPAASVILEAFECTQHILNDIENSIAKNNICIELVKQQKIQESLECATRIIEDWIKSRALKDISIELVNLGKIEEAFECIQDITDYADKSSILKCISTSLSKQGKTKQASSVMQEALEYADKIINKGEKSRAMKDITFEIVKQGKIEEALEYAREIRDNEEKSRALNYISTQLSKLGKLEEGASVMKEAFAFAHGSSDVYNELTSDLVKRRDWVLAEKMGLEISEIAERQDCWKKISEVVIQENDALTSFSYASQFKSIEAQTYYLKGWAENINLIDVNSTLLYQSILIDGKNISFLESLLQKYAFNQVFFGNMTSEKMSRLNRTLKIQWAIDIKNQFT